MSLDTNIALQTPVTFTEGAISEINRLMAEPDFDRVKVESIKQAISEGNYPLDVKRIAESFVAIERMINA
jgi:flagellar biosynthesis anti-sigma factor FlgM